MNTPGRVLTEAPLVDSEESPRDIEESAFTPILRALMQSDPSLRVAVFLDAEGECVDYVSLVDPFDAKVFAAQMLVVMMQLRGKSGGEPRSMHVHTNQHDLLVRRIGDGYALFIAFDGPVISEALRESMDLAVRALREEGGIERPHWEPALGSVHVELRESTAGWSYAPVAFWTEGERVAVSDVLGRWRTEHDGLCFLIRTASGREMVLEHRLCEELWQLAPHPR